MKNYITRFLFAIGMLIRNIIKLVFSIIGILFHFIGATFFYILVLFGRHSGIEEESKKLVKREFNFLDNIIRFENYFHLK